MIAAFIKEHRLFLSFHHAGVGFCSMVTTGTAAWGAVLFARVHGWSPSQIGLAEGLALIAGGILGMLGGGALSDYLSRRGPHMRLVVCVFAGLGAAIAGVSFPLVDDPNLAIVLLGAVFMFAGMPFGAANAALQLIAPDAIRGAVSALFFFSLSMIGGLGPALIAILSDRWFPTPDGIRFAIAIVIPAASLLAAICYALSVGPYRRTSVVQQLNGGVKVTGPSNDGAPAVADA
ncbi:MAG: MFS transporter [Sphingomonadales bacterium]|nr:MAG: MFS transporter [Sphingomonadales bacterium]